MDLTKIKTALDRCSPALGVSDTVEIFGDFCFEEDMVTAYDNRHGIQVPFNSPFEGGLDGAVLTGILNTITNTDFGFEMKKDKVWIKHTDPDWTFNFKPSPPEKFLFRDLHLKKKNKFVANKVFIESLRLVLYAASPDPTEPRYFGAWIVEEGDDYYLIASDRSRLAKSRLPDDMEIPSALLGYILPYAFCKNLFHIYDGDDITASTVTLCPVKDEDKDFIVAEFEDGSRVFSRQYNKEHPPLTLKHFKIIYDAHGYTPIPIPKEFTNAVIRCDLALMHEDNPRGNLEVKDGKLNFANKGYRNEQVEDWMDLPQNDVRIVVQTKLLLTVMPHCELMEVSTDGVLLVKEGFEFLANADEAPIKDG